MVSINFGFLKDLFKEEPTNFMGVDIGTSAVKIVELTKEKERAKLLTYGEAGTYYAIEKLTDIGSMKNQQQISDTSIVELIKDLKASVKTKSAAAVFSLPLASSFSTVMEFPKMKMEEIEKAIEYEARQYVPIPISEVSLKWNILSETKKEQQPASDKSAKDEEKIEVLLVAVPKEVIFRYESIAKSAGIEILDMELESYSSARAVIGNDKMTTVLIDIGARSSDISIIDESVVKFNHNLDIGGADITRVISQSLSIPLIRAEELKKEFGLSAGGGEKEISNLMSSVVDLIITEAQRMTDVFTRKKNKKIERIIMVGGGASLPGIGDYFATRLGAPVSLGNPFSKIIYPPELEPIIKRIGPSYCVATGLALRNLPSY